MRILLVDDEVSYLGVMENILQRAGHSVIRAEDGKAARELIDIETVDLVISDVLMPTLDGARFHSYVREFTANNEVPFIFVSGLEEAGLSLVSDPRRDFFVSKSAPVDTILRLIDAVSRSAAASTS